MDCQFSGRNVFSLLKTHCLIVFEIYMLSNFGFLNEKKKKVEISLGRIYFSIKQIMLHCYMFFFFLISPSILCIIYVYVLYFVTPDKIISNNQIF